MNVTLSTEPCANSFRQLGENVRPRIISNSVHRVETQSIEVVLLEPVQRVVNEEIAHCPGARTVKVDRLSPRSAVTVGEELRCVETERVAFRAEVVIDNVKKNHQILRMGRIHKMLQLFRCSVTACRCVRQDAVISPIT